MDKEQQLVNKKKSQFLEIIRRYLQGGKLIINGKTFAIYGGVNTIGRNREAIVNIKNLGISQNHAIIILVDDDLQFISDVKSSNGTFLDGEKLIPLQLYELRNQAKVKFSDVEGTYNKLSSQDEQTSVSIDNLGCSQSITQTFYGIDTQILDETSAIMNKTKIRSNPTQNSNYIPTQVLEKAAIELEESYVKFHEQSTLLAPSLAPQNDNKTETQERPILTINTQIREEMSYDMGINETLNHIPDDETFMRPYADVSNYHKPDASEKSTVFDQSSVDFHEAKTQKIPETQGNISKSDSLQGTSAHIRQNDFHEAETQKIPETQGNTSHSRNLQGASAHILQDDFHEAETQKIPESQGNISNSGNLQGTSAHTLQDDFHEAETQKIPKTQGNISQSFNSQGTPAHILHDDLHEAETQKIPETQGNISQSVNLQGTSAHVLHDDLHEAETQKIIVDSQVYNMDTEEKETESQSNTSHTEVNNLENSQSIKSPPQSEQPDAKCAAQTVTEASDLTKQPESRMNSQTEEISQRDFIKPLGKCRKTINDLEDSDTDLDNQSDIIKPVKISNNSIQFSQESVVDDDSGEGSDDSLEFMTMQKVNVSQIKYTEEINQDQTKARSPEYCNKQGKKNVIIDEDSETDNEKDDNTMSTIGKNEVIIRNKLGKKEHNAENQEESSSVDKNSSGTNPETSHLKQGIKRNKNVKPIKKDNRISDSDSETDIEIEINRDKSKTEISVHSQPKRTHLPAGSDSDTEIEDNVNDEVPNKRIYSKIFDKSKIEKSVQNSKSYDDNSRIISNERLKRTHLPPGSDSDTEIEDNTNDEVPLKKNDSTMFNEQENKENIHVSQKEELLAERSSPAGTSKVKRNERKDSSLYREADSEDDNLVIDETSFEDSLLNTSATKTSDGSFLIKKMIGINASLNESDVIPSTQFDGIVKHSSQTSRCENSEESFKLGLTQLMEDEVCVSQEKDASQNNSSNQTCSIKTTEESQNSKFATSNLLINGNSQDNEDEGIYDVSTQKITVDKKIETSNEDHIFLQPTQKLPLKKRESNDKNIPEEDLYFLSTQKMDDSPDKDACVIEDIYIQPTQPLVSQNQGISRAVTKSAEPEKNQRSVQSDDDDEDMFASQPINTKTVPDRALESELECMFATQRTGFTEDTIDKIQDVICQKQFIEAKLPEADSDLEAMLATQSMISPISKKNTKKSEEKEVLLGRNIESQLEVLFASQPNALPTDKFLRPSNPLVNVLKEDSQDAGQLEVSKNIHNTNDISLDTGNKTRNGLEQSFALLEAKVTKIKRSTRKTDSEEVTVSCSTSRRSNAVAPREEKLKMLGEIFSTETKRSTRKRGSSAVTTINEKKSKKTQSSNTTEGTSSTTKLADLNGTKRSERVREYKFTLPRKSTRGRPSESDDEVFIPQKISKVNSGIDRNTRSLDNKKSSLKSENIKLTLKATHSKETNQKIKLDSGNQSCSKENDSNTVTRSRKNIETRKTSVAYNSSTDSDSSLKTRKSTSSNLSDMEALDTPTRNKRKLKPKVVFTMMDDPQAESAIRRLGGTIVESVFSCTVLITQSVKRTQKLLSAIGLAKPICSTKWIDACKIYNQFLDPWDFLLVDEVAEKNWDFSLQTSLERSSRAKLFNGLTFQLLVTNATDVLKGAIESCGGKVITRCPKEINDFFIVAAPENKDKIKKLRIQNPHYFIIEPEAIFDGVLRQEIRFERHRLK